MEERNADLQKQSTTERTLQQISKDLSNLSFNYSRPIFYIVNRQTAAHLIKLSNRS